MVLATAVAVLGEKEISPENRQAIAGRLHDADAAVRVEALAALLPYPPEQRLALAAALLEDDSRAVRAEAARVLAAAHARFDEMQKTAFATASEDFVRKQDVISDRAAGHMMLAIF